MPLAGRQTLGVEMERQLSEALRLEPSKRNMYFAWPGCAWLRTILLFATPAGNSCRSCKKIRRSGGERLCN